MASPPEGRVGRGAELAGATRVLSGAIAGPRLAVPLTERILSRLPAPSSGS
jgi:hypothetical protein